ncbi:MULTISPECIES: hypothetical protein [Nostoc]|uniref:Uncharacterized protein n=1 Tax=Nostoc paludosum FACHB-159 TaxID=2692908 RepID=A0ABR8KKI3_9NOSO|nr:MULTISPECIES: hypothetical protein [Nostoc]MBD2682991.1 hypothetical protein [Nostoc sp. FACHB-857]MBD2739331.1 hypothetical protein [Nostoc paludosum FACHB-159]
MGRVWTYWEFDHPLGSTVRVISTPLGLEIFTEDVFNIVAAELNNEKIVLMNIHTQERYVVIEEEVVKIKTLNVTAINSLKTIVKADLINKFVHWVRTTIRPLFPRQYL